MDKNMSLEDLQNMEIIKSASTFKEVPEGFNPNQALPVKEAIAEKTAPGAEPVVIDNNDEEATVVTNVDDDVSDDDAVINISNVGFEKPTPTASEEMSQKPAVVPSTAGIEDVEMTMPTAPTGLPAVVNEMTALIDEHLKDVPREKRGAIANPIVNSAMENKKQYMMSGLTPDEAETAVKNAIIKALGTANDEYVKENADTAVITIDKTDAADISDLALTPEEHEKIEKVRKIRLVAVEDVELDCLKIERPSEEHKIDYIRSIDGAISKYSVPLPLYGDYVTFKGAQILQLINAVNYEDATTDEIINMRASLIYERLGSGATLRRFDENGRSVMSYAEFLNTFPFMDMNMAMYAIVCASSPESNTTQVKCNKCQHKWDQRYEAKKLLRLDNIDDTFKERIDSILKYKNDDGPLTAIHNDHRKAIRFRSQTSNNIFEISYPTIARAINIFKKIDNDDPVMNYLSAVILCLGRAFIYNPVKDTYIEVTAEEVELMLEVAKGLSNEDIQLITDQVGKHLIYTPEFIIECTCPKCGNKYSLPIEIESAIFQLAQDMPEVIVE